MKKHNTNQADVMPMTVPVHGGKNLESSGASTEIREKLSALIERVDLLDQGLAIESTTNDELDGRISACEANLGIDRITIEKRTYHEK